MDDSFANEQSKLGDIKKDKVIKVEVPSVYTLTGNGSEFCKGYCLTCAFSTEIILTIEKGKDKTVNVKYPQRKEKKSFKLSKLKYKNSDAWLNYVKAVYKVLLNQSDKIEECNITIETEKENYDLNHSRLYIITGTIFALNKFFDLKLEKKEMIRLSYLASGVFDEDAAPLHDISTLFYAKKDHITKFDLDNGTIKYLAFSGESMSNYNFLLIDPCVTPKSIMVNEIKSKRYELKQAFNEFEAILPKDIKLRECPILDLKSRSIKMNEVATRDCIFALLDSKLTFRAASEIRKDDVKALAKTLSKIYVSMKDDLGFFSTEIDWIIHHGKQIEGVLGATIAINAYETHVLMITEKNIDDELLEKLDLYSQLFGYKPTVSYLAPRDAMT